jgi:hypothetical protein
MAGPARAPSPTQQLPTSLAAMQVAIAPPAEFSPHFQHGMYPLFGNQQHFEGELNHHFAPFGQHQHPHFAPQQASNVSDMMMGHSLVQREHEGYFHHHRHAHPGMLGGGEHRPEDPLTGASSQPQPRKRGRPPGSKDVVQRVRRFTKRAKKVPQKSTDLGDSPTSPSTGRGGAAANDARGEDDGIQRVSSYEYEEDSSSSGGSGAEKHDEKFQAPERQEPHPEVGDASHPAHDHADPLVSDVTARGQGLQHTGDPENVELVDKSWFALHEQLFRRRKPGENLDDD